MYRQIPRAVGPSGSKQPGRKGVGHHQVPVRAVARRGRTRERRTPSRRLAGTNSEPSAGDVARHARLSGGAFRAGRPRIGARREAEGGQARPDTSQRRAGPAMPLPVRGARGHVGVHRTRTARGRAGRYRPEAPDLPREAARARSRGREPVVDACPVAGEPEVLGGRDEHRAGAPAREPHGKPAERKGEDRLRDVGVAVRRHDPRSVERLGERELLVGVPDAVAPGEDRC